MRYQNVHVYGRGPSSKSTRLGVWHIDLTKKNRARCTTGMDGHGHPPSPGWLRTSLRIVTHPHPKYNQPTSQGRSPSFPKMVTHHLKDCHPLSQNGHPYQGCKNASIFLTPDMPIQILPNLFPNKFGTYLAQIL